MKKLGKMARIRFQGTPNCKTAVGKMPQPIRAPLEVMNANGNSNLGFLWPESSWVWPCSSCQGIRLENWGRFL